MNTLEMALACLERKAFGRAEVLLKEYVVRHPDNLYAHMELVGCFYTRQTGISRWRACDEFYREVYRAPNARALETFLRGEQRFYDGLYEAAVEAYTAALNAGLEAAAVHHSLALAWKKLGRFTNAREAFTQALNLDPGFLPAKHSYAKWQFDEGNFSCVDHLTRLMPTAPKESGPSTSYEESVRMYAELADIACATRTLREAVVLHHQKRDRDAVAALWPTVQKYITNYALVRALILLLLDADWFFVGRRRLEGLLDNGSAVSHYVQGQIALQDGKTVESLRAFDEALSLGPSHPLALCARATVLHQLDRDDDAMGDLLLAHTLESELSLVRANLADHTFRRKEFAEASVYASLSAEERRSATAYEVDGLSNLAAMDRIFLKAELSLGHHKEMLRAVRASGNPFTANAVGLANGLVLAANGCMEEARDQVSEALAHDNSVAGTCNAEESGLLSALFQTYPDVYELALADALACAYAGDLDKAYEGLVAVVDRHGRRPSALLHLGRIAFMKGRPEESAGLMHELLQLDPDNEEALECLCAALASQENLEGLMELAKDQSCFKLPLQYALPLAEKGGSGISVVEIALAILAIQPDSMDALATILRFTKSSDPRVFEGLCQYARYAFLDFEMKGFIAHGYLERGELEEASRLLDELVSAGDRRLSVLVDWGIAHVPRLSR